MTKIPIVFHSQSGDTQNMSEAMVKGKYLPQLFIQKIHHHLVVKGPITEEI